MWGRDIGFGGRQTMLLLGRNRGPEVEAAQSTWRGSWIRARPIFNCANPFSTGTVVDA